MFKIFPVLALLLSSFVTAQISNYQKIDAIVNSKIGENDPALFVGVVKDGKIIYENYRGVSSLQHLAKADKNSVSNIASTAKQFTALMILQLALDDKLSLEDDIRKYLPSLYPKVKEEIKIRHLLNHTSGVRDFYDLLSIKQDPWWKKVGMDNDDALKLLEKQEDLAFIPGTKFVYSNSGYTLLTKIIEKASGTDFHEYSKKFFENLGMKNTHFLKNYMYVIPNVSLPYSDWGDGIWQQYPMLTNLYGDGFLFTSLKDQLYFEQAVQNANYNNNILLIESQKPIKNSEIQSYGYGLYLSDKLNRKAVHHSGGTGSYHSQMIRFPEEKLSVFVMSSNSKIWSGYIANEIASLLLPAMEIEKKYDAQINDKKLLDVENDIVGQYISKDEYLIRIFLENGKLFWRNANNNPIELVQEEKNIYHKKGWTREKLGFFGNEMITFYDTGSKKSYQKLASEQPTSSELERFIGKYKSNELDVSFEISKGEKNELLINLEGWKKKAPLEILNRNELLVYDYILKIKRDPFNSVREILLTTNRALNNKFVKQTNLQYQPKINLEEGSISVTNIGDKNGTTQILLTKNDEKGNEVWWKKFGGNAYDKASSIYKTKQGFLIVGSTSSYGKGNYDVLVFEVDENGKKLWQNTYGDFYNDYGYALEQTANGYLIKGTKQDCTSNSDVFNRKCKTNVWVVSIDKNGKELSNTLLEEIKN